MEIKGLNVHLSKMPIRGRIIHALKYIFGYRSKFGDFDEFIIDSQNKGHFYEILSQIK